jgi:hypothetical protein
MRIPAPTPSHDLVLRMSSLFLNQNQCFWGASRGDEIGVVDSSNTPIASLYILLESEPHRP